GIRDFHVTGVQTCALPILLHFGNLDQIATNDPDNDGCNNGCEETRGLDPNNGDSDKDAFGNPTPDGLKDGDEAYVYKTNPLVPRSEERRVGKECRARGRAD